MRGHKPAAGRQFPVSNEGLPRARTRLAERLLDLVIVFFAFAIGGAALTGATLWRIGDVGSHDNVHHADAIVVLGAAQYNGCPSPVLKARLDHAIDLYARGYAPYLVMTGGNLPGDVYTEAQAGTYYAEHASPSRCLGKTGFTYTRPAVPAAAILSETAGSTTLESMQNVRALFQAHDLHSAVFVSDRTHMLRVLRMAADQGIEGWGSPTTTSPTDLDPSLRTNSTLHELAGLEYYFCCELP